MNAIEIKNITKAYKDFTLENISFSLPMGTIMGLVGENGAGKSTTIKLIMNAIAPDSGSVSVLGISNQSNEFAALKQDIGIVLDEAYFPEVLSASDINKIMTKTYINWSKDIYFDYLKKFKLPFEKKFKDYSRGMKMKLAIAVQFVISLIGQKNFAESISMLLFAIASGLIFIAINTPILFRFGSEKGRFVVIIAVAFAAGLGSIMKNRNGTMILSMSNSLPAFLFGFAVILNFISMCISIRIKIK